MQDQLFNRTMTEALKATGSPDWERKKKVAKAREARIVVSKEVRSLVKEVASRNRTNQQTVVWLAMQKLWEMLNYSRRDYDEIMCNHNMPEFLQLSREELRQVANVVEDIDHHYLENGEPKTDEEISARNEFLKEKLSTLNEHQARMCREFLSKRNLLFGADKLPIQQGNCDPEIADFCQMAGLLDHDPTVEQFVERTKNLDETKKRYLKELLVKKGVL